MTVLLSDASAVTEEESHQSGVFPMLPRFFSASNDVASTKFCSGSCNCNHFDLSQWTLLCHEGIHQHIDRR